MTGEGAAAARGAVDRVRQPLTACGAGVVKRFVKWGGCLRAAVLFCG